MEQCRLLCHKFLARTRRPICRGR